MTRKNTDILFSVSLHDLAETLRAGAHISKTPAFATEMRVRDFSIGLEFQFSFALFFVKESSRISF